MKRMIILFGIIAILSIIGCTDNNINKDDTIKDIVTPCTREYMPVCGSVQVKCITTPCDPVDMTFANSCEAENAGATVKYEGECAEVQKETNLIEGKDLEKSCIDINGKFLAEFNECEGISEKSCTELGGEFFECESACRNDPDAEMCIEMCVQVCKF